MGKINLTIITEGDPVIQEPRLKHLLSEFLRANGFTQDGDGKLPNLPEEYISIEEKDPILGDLVDVYLEDGSTAQIIWEGSPNVPVTTRLKVLGWK